MTAGELAVILEGRGSRVRPRQGGQGFMAQCPAHPDGRRLSLAIGTGRDGRRLVHCFNGCGVKDIRLALGLPREAFEGWSSYDNQRLRSQKPFTGVPSLTPIISGSCVLGVKALLGMHRDGRIEPGPVTLPLPPRARRTTRLVAADMELLFGLADAAGVGDVPLMYSMHWAARRLDADPSMVARSLRSLVQHGALVRAKDVPAWNGRATRTYRRAGR